MQNMGNGNPILRIFAKMLTLSILCLKILAIKEKGEVLQHLSKRVSVIHYHVSHALTVSIIAISAFFFNTNVGLNKGFSLFFRTVYAYTQDIV